MIKTQFKEKTVRGVLESFLIRDLKEIKNKRILEIGCGQWDFAKKIIEKNNNQWFGLEPVDFQDKNITSIKGSVKKIPFHDNTFDYVICNQTIEHWFEYSVSFKKALKEINRVLKSKGILMINAPIHFHGHPYFLRGDFKKIVKIFNKKIWKIKHFERCFPSVNFYAWKKIAGKGFFSKIGYPSILVKNNKKAFSYQLNIHAQKLIQNSQNVKKDRFRPFKVILRFTKEILFYPI